MLNKGSWIFLSHSSHDIEKVRIIRNEFERLGHNPLTFHLKCLTDKTEDGKKELFDLIKREIEAREWFVFCESPEAKKSPNVALEHSYILNSGKDKIWSIDMTQDINSILYNVKKICTSIEVFISYSHKDHELIKPLINTLVEKDYSVWTDENIKPSSKSFEEQISDAIYTCSKRGFYIIVISDNSTDLRYVKNELNFAYANGATIIPIVLGSPHISTDILFYISRYQYISVDLLNIDYDLVINKIETTVKNKILNT